LYGYYLWFYRLYERKVNMNIWVEWFRWGVKEQNTWAQMSEQTHWVEPDPKDINRRFFDKQEDASLFAKRMNDRGYHAKVKRDGII